MNISCDFDNRIIYLYDEINSESSGYLCENILKMIFEDDLKEKSEKNVIRKTIHIMINSNGGTIYDALALVNIIRTSKTPICTYAVGACLSAAMLVLIAGHCRYAYPYSKMMIHQISAGHKLIEVKKLKEFATHIQDDQNDMDNFIISRTKISSNLLKKIYNNVTDYYISPTEALELGCVDGIMKTLDDLTDNK